MNAEGLLRKQGWRGAGYSLDTTGRGIKKPLLISHKQDQLGLGKKKASHTTDDQWWMRAFDESLQNLGTGQTSTLSQIQEKGINRGGLYGFFVKGEGLVGTIGEESSSPTSGASTPPTSASDGASTDENESDTDCTSSDDAASDSSKMTKPNKGQNKRKRAVEDDVPSTKKLKQDQSGVEKGVPPTSSTDNEVRTGLGPISAADWPKVCAIMSRIDKLVKYKAKKNEKAGAYGDATNVDDPKNPSKKLAKKAAKVEHQKVIRAAKKLMVKELVVEALVKGEMPLNPQNWTREEILKNYGKIDKAIKAVDHAYSARNKTERQAKREQRKEAKAEKARAQVRNKTKMQQQSTIEAHLAQLDPSKQVEYAARAAEKGQTLEEYTLRRIEKKDAKRAEKGTDKEDDQQSLVKPQHDPTIAPWKAQIRAKRRLKKESKEKSAKLKGKLKNKYKVSQKAKARNEEAKNGGAVNEAVATGDGAVVKGARDEKVFREKAERFGAVATPIAVSA